MARGGTSTQPLPDQPRPDPLPLAVGEDGNRCESQCVQRAGLRDDGQIAEKDVSDDQPALLGHQGHAGVSAVAEGVHEAGLVLLPECLAIDLADGLQSSGVSPRTTTPNCNSMYNAPGMGLWQ